MINNNKYINNGVYVTPSEVTKGSKIRIAYDGILSKSGASDVFAHVGFGNKWDNSQDLKMSKTPSGFETSFSVTKSSPVYVCFKDSANNWDNNSGHNYTFDVIS